MNSRIGALPLLARTRHDFARMLAERGAPGTDRERADCSTKLFLCIAGSA